VIDAAGNTTVSLDLSDTGGSVVDAASEKLYVDGVLQTGVTTSPTQVSKALTGLAAGAHTITVEFADAVGNAATSTWSFTMVRDSTPPVVTAISAPVASAPLTVAAGANIAVSYSYVEVNPAYVSITVRSGGTVIGSTVVGAGLQPSASRTDTVALLAAAATGVYDVSVTVVDQVGQSGSLTSNAGVVLDATKPVASNTVNPTGGSTVVDVNGTTVVAAYLSDAGGAGIDTTSIKLMIDGAYKNGATVAANGTGYSVSFTTSGGNALAAGQHYISVFYADKVGNVGAQKNWSFTMVRDNTPPVISAISAPTTAAKAYARAGGVVDVTWLYTEVNPAWVSITVKSGGTIVGNSTISSGLVGGAGVVRTDSVTLLSGTAESVYDLIITMVDTAGQTGTAQQATSVLVDNTAPVASAGLPAGGSIVQTASPAIQASLSDLGGSGVDTSKVVLTLDGSVVTPSILTTAVVGYNASGLADGQHTVSVKLKDASTNAAQTYVWTFRTDVSNPDVTLTLPAAGAYISATPSVEALATDAGSGVTRTAFYFGGTLIGTSWFNGQTWVDNNGNVSPSASVKWDTTLLADGVYVIKATALDLVGNTGTSSNRTVTIDNTLPVITINPVFSPTQYASQTVTGSVVDQNLAQLKVNGILATLGGSAPNWTYSAVVPLNPGANGITVTASDLAGNGSSLVTGITMDPTAAVHFVHPAPGEIFRASTGLEVTAPPATNTLTLEVSPDSGATWYSVATPAVAAAKTTLAKNVVDGWRQTWDTINDGLADGNGTYQLRAVAYDQYGTQLGSAVVAGLSTDNTAPQVSFQTLPAPVLVGANNEVYQELITNQGSVTETGSGQVRVLVEHYNGTGDHVSDSPAWFPLLSGGTTFSRDERLVSGYNRIVYTVVDGAGNSASSSAIIHYVLPQNSGTICAGGGSLAAPDGTAINVPSGALVSCVSLSIKTILRSLLASPADPYLKIVGEGHQVEPVSLVFQAQAVLTLPYTDADLDPDANGIPDYTPQSLKVLFWDGSVWQNVGVDSVNTTTKRITVRTNHLGLFALAADTAPIPSEAKVYLTRNPFRYGTDKPTSFVYELPVSGRVTIKIFDKTGDLVRTLVDDLPQTQGRFTQVWDGLNNFDRFVGSGIYLFRFEAVLSNGQTTTSTKAIGVLK
jgi:hypothetical protein